MNKKDIFHFKQFHVNQEGCAMRINTDGVLLAAMAQSNKTKAVLDIGTGTGVIALMLAQRYPAAQVNAVEIEYNAAKRAESNFKLSPFANRLSLFHADILAFNSHTSYDLIVSNPPYFVNDLKNININKGLARHTSENFFELLIVKIAQLLNKNGYFWFILPCKQAENLIQNAQSLGLFPSKIITVHSDKNKKAFRYLVCLSKENQVSIKEDFYIYESEKIYSTAYKDLLKDFFITF